LADEVGEVISIPSLHIFGCEDALLSSAIALFNVCNQSCAEMYDHGLGHIVPRDTENVESLGCLLQELISKYEAEPLIDLRRVSIFEWSESETSDSEESAVGSELVIEKPSPVLGGE
jgi:hypothetical protein